MLSLKIANDHNATLRNKPQLQRPKDVKKSSATLKTEPYLSLPNSNDYKMKNWRRKRTNTLNVYMRPNSFEINGK